MTNILTLGPMLFNWPEQQKVDFYNKIADEADVDVVYIGEVVCQKRFACWGKVYDQIVTRLKNSGKKVIISSLALINTEQELQKIRDYIENDALMIEANDVSVLNILADSNFCVGPYVNVYNEEALNVYANLGAKHITISPELPRNSIEVLANCNRIDLEMTVFGRLPLAISARCAHARIYKQQKSNCRYVCEQDLDGLQVTTLDQQPFLSINGLQTMSHTYVNLANEISSLQKIGIKRFRVSPHTGDMLATLQIYRKLLQKDIDVREASCKLQAIHQNVDFSNGFFHGSSGYKSFKEVEKKSLTQ